MLIGILSDTHDLMLRDILLQHPGFYPGYHMNKGRLKGKKLAAFACQSGNGAEKALTKLKEQIGIDNFVAELILIDPKTKEISSNDDKINSFCEKIKS